jgi:dihydroxy-acid dehydratase
MPNQDRRSAGLRSQRWFDSDGMRAFGHRSRMMQMGFAPDEYRGKPIIAIVNTWSGLAHCHAHFSERAKDVARGVAMNGGFPVEVPVMALPETLTKPSSMLYRNLLAMEVEETLRSLPVDGAVLMGGCDKTTPALLMGAIAPICPLFSCRPAQCCEETGAVAYSALAATFGSTGTKNVPERSPRPTGPKWRPA